VKVGIVGTGGVALRHPGVLSQLPDIEIVGHVSLDSSSPPKISRTASTVPGS
jgi:predicted dehydrogenase